MLKIRRDLQSNTHIEGRCDDKCSRVSRLHLEMAIQIAKHQSLMDTGLEIKNLGILRLTQADLLINMAAFDIMLLEVFCVSKFHSVGLMSACSMVSMYEHWRISFATERKCPWHTPGLWETSETLRRDTLNGAIHISIVPRCFFVREKRTAPQTC